MWWERKRKEGKVEGKVKGEDTKRKYHNNYQEELKRMVRAVLVLLT